MSMLRCPFMVSAVALGFGVPSLAFITTHPASRAKRAVPWCPADVINAAKTVQMDVAQGVTRWSPGDVAWLAARGAEECMVEGRPGAKTSMTVVLEKGPIICQSDVKEETRLERVSDNITYSIKTFILPKAMPAGGLERFYAQAMPRRSYCSPENPCPLVVNLHGAGEHGDPEKLAIWAFLNYYEKDQECRWSLRSALLFPLLERDETWSMHGPQSFDSFVIPLLEHFLQKHIMVDSNRVALVGYSEGAIGAVHGATLYPNIFDLVAAGSPIIPEEEWNALPAVPRPEHQTPPKLKAIVLGWASEDQMDPTISIDKVFHMLHYAGTADHARIRARLYMGDIHMGAAEALLNHDALLHAILWDGQWDKLSEL